MSSLVFLIACVPEPPGSTSEPSLGGQSGEDPGSFGPCEEEATIGEPDDVFSSPDGSFTPNDVLNLANGTFSAVLTWQDAPVTEVAVELVWDGEIRLVTGLGEYYSTCDGRVEIDGNYTFTTADGLLAESGATTLVARRASETSFIASWDEDALVGAWPFPPDDLVSTLTLQAFVDADGIDGWITLSTSHGNTASESGPIATFGP